MSTVSMTALSGSGENGRNCYMIAAKDGCILLDCGVQREIRDGQVGFYPPLTRELVASVKAVFLSHCHEDHVAALPLLYELGYKGNVYATPETIAETPGFMKKWQEFVKKNNGVLPFAEETTAKVQLCPIELGVQEMEGITFETGRSGHVLGGIWYRFTVDGKQLLYTGDMCLQPVSMGVDVPEFSCDAVIMNAAYAGKVMIQEKQYQSLLNSVKKTLAAGGRVLLPVPSKGRGIDMLLYLEKKLSEAKIYAEQAVVTSMQKLAQQKKWIQGEIDTTLAANVIVIDTEEKRHAAMADTEPAVILTPDGMITTDVSTAYLEAVKGDANNKVIITGHAAAGTSGAGILDDTYRSEHGVLATAEKIVFKVHLDDEDIQTVAEKTGAKKLLLFHSDSPNTVRVKEALAAKGAEAVTLQYPEMIEI